MEAFDDRLGRVMAMALKGMRASLDAKLTVLGSSFSAYLVLRAIDAHPGLSQRDLAARLGIEGPTLTHHLDRLAERGLVERVRSAEDRRVWSTMLTADGRAELRRTGAVAEQANAELRALFSPDELAHLTDYLHRIIDRYGRQPLDDHSPRPGPLRSTAGGH